VTPTATKVFLVVLIVTCFVLGVWLLMAAPFYILGRRRGVKHAWVAFVLPGFGIAIVLFNSIGLTGWLSLLLFIPTVGGAVVWVWAALAVPANHGRSHWWTVALIVPGVSWFAYWVYALTLPREQDDFAFA
jgi:hypothetical protein